MKAGHFNEGKIKYTAEDIRFTVKGRNLYAYFLDTPGNEFRIRSLGRNAGLNDKKISSVKLLGYPDKVQWKQEDDALVISRPAQLPSWKVIGVKLEMK